MPAGVTPNRRQDTVYGAMGVAAERAIREGDCTLFRHLEPPDE